MAKVGMSGVQSSKMKQVRPRRLKDPVMGPLNKLQLFALLIDCLQDKAAKFMKATKTHTPSPSHKSAPDFESWPTAAT